MNVYQQAIEKWGKEEQIVVAIEELAELQQALTKHLRGLGGNVEEEMADVYIVLQELKEMFDNDIYGYWLKFKRNRLEQQIKSEKD